MTDLQPRGIRQKDAWGYLGVDKNFFLKEVKPSLHPKKKSRKVVIYDRLELDAWFDQYIGRHGASQEETWDNLNYPEGSVGESGPTARSIKTSTSPRRTVERDLERARERMMSQRRKGGSEEDSTPSTKSKSTG